VADAPEKAFETWLDINKDDNINKVERLAESLDGLYIEFQKEMLTPEGQATLRSMAQRRIIGIWTRAGIHPDKLEVVKSLTREAGAALRQHRLPALLHVRGCMAVANAGRSARRSGLATSAPS